jgi:hypothetical protein
MKEDRRKILAMLASGKISVEEADRLLMAADSHWEPVSTPRFLRLKVEPKAGSENERTINIRVPLGVIRSSLQIAQSLPASKRGPMMIALGTHMLSLDVGNMNMEDADEFIANFADLSTNIDNQKETLRLFCE